MSAEPEVEYEPEPETEYEPEPESEYSPEPEMEPTYEPEVEPSYEPEVEVDPEGPLGRASDMEMVMPAFALVGLIILGLLIYSMVTQPDWWLSLCRCRSTPSGRASVTPEKEYLLMTSSDRHVQSEFIKFQNNPVPLMRIAMPTTLSLLFCPATLYMYPPLSQAFWPSEYFDEVPNINDAITCFLTPAGLVYAIAFGFAFQEAVAVMTSYSSNITKFLTDVDQLQSMTERLTCVSSDQKCTIIRTLKKEVVAWMANIIGHKHPPDFTEPNVWQVIDTLHEPKKCPVDELDRRFIEEMISRALTMSTALQFSTNTRINLLQWLFLELLGFISFFGVLLVKAESYRLELTICILTVFSISLFCYVLADFDDPFHGFFKVDLSGFCDAIERLEDGFLRLHQSRLHSNVGPDIQQLRC